MMQAMIFAAGLGTRLKPLTEKVPKALIEVGGMTLLERVVLKLKAAGVQRMVINVHHFSERVIRFIRAKDNFGMEVIISDESSCLLETGGGIKKAGRAFDPQSPVLLHNVDILSNADLQAFYSQNLTNDATLLVSNRDTKRYLLFDNDMNLVGWTHLGTGEIRSPYPRLNIDKCRRYAFSGIHLFSPRLLKLMDNFPEKFGIMDFYLSVCHQTNIRGSLQEGLQLIDVGKIDTLKEAEQLFCRL